MKRPFAVMSFIILGTVAAAAVAGAQPGAGAGRGELRGPVLRQTPLGRAIAPIDETNAHDTEQRLQELLQQYPPSLGRVLALDIGMVRVLPSR